MEAAGDVLGFVRAGEGVKAQAEGVQERAQEAGMSRSSGEQRPAGTVYAPLHCMFPRCQMLAPIVTCPRKLEGHRSGTTERP